MHCHVDWHMKLGEDQKGEAEREWERTIVGECEERESKR
jgi:hypothetical protein